MDREQVRRHAEKASDGRDGQGRSFAVFDAEQVRALLAELEHAEPLAAQYEALASVLRPVAKDLGLREGWTFDALGERLRERLSALEQAERERDGSALLKDLAEAKILRLEAQLAKVPALVEALRLERCNGCGKPRKEWGPVCGGMYQGDNTHYHSVDWWLSRYEVSEGDPAEVRPSDSRAESQAELNGPSGSPTSPSEPVDVAFDALLWISEYPNRELSSEDDSDAIALAEFAREALATYEQAQGGKSC